MPYPHPVVFLTFYFDVSTLVSSKSKERESLKFCALFL